jgi:hypothetical protein
MDLKRKIEICTQAIESISRHDDEDAAVVKAALDKVISVIELERAQLDAKVAARVAESLG